MEEHERPAEDARSVAGSEEIIVQPLCDCASSGSEFVVFTCPRCMGSALRALEAAYGE